MATNAAMLSHHQCRARQSAERNVQYLLTKKFTTIADNGRHEPSHVSVTELAAHERNRQRRQTADTIKPTMSAITETAMNESPSRPTWPVERNVQAG